MAKDKPLAEDAVPVTTTANAGGGMVLPEKPMNMLSRFREMKKSRKPENNK